MDIATTQKRRPARSAPARVRPAARRLSPRELGDLAEAMAGATGKDEAARLKQRFIDGFYGARPPGA
jgi:hypothetical protein